jgi:hypothetical protein
MLRLLLWEVKGREESVVSQFDLFDQKNTTNNKNRRA